MAYATLDEFKQRMNLTGTTPAQDDTAQGCIDAATQEIDSFLDWETTGAPTDLTVDQLALLEIVNIDRAAEHWRLTPFGALPQAAETGPILTARDSWYRHARKLASLQHAWGVA